MFCGVGSVGNIPQPIMFRQAGGCDTVANLGVGRGGGGGGGGLWRLVKVYLVSVPDPTNWKRYTHWIKLWSGNETKVYSIVQQFWICSDHHF